MTVQNNTDVSSVKHENRRRDSPYPLAVAAVGVVAVAVAAAGSSGGGGGGVGRCFELCGGVGKTVVKHVRRVK